MPTIEPIRKLTIATKEIILFKADANYTEIMLLDGSRIVISKTLKKVEKLVANHGENPFFRVHKSFIINRNHVQGYSLNEASEVHLPNELKATISRRRRDAFVSYMQAKP